MENQKLALFQGITNPIEAAQQLGEAFAASGLFGCSKPQQGTVLAMQCLATGMSPFELTQTYHIIDGKLSMKSDAMLGRFLSAGGKVVWGTRTAEKVVGRFIYRDNDLEMSQTMQELIASGVAMHKGELKDTYRRHPRQMLTARLISEAVRLLAPEIVSGCYTPEEIGDFGSETLPPAPPKPEPPKTEEPKKAKAPKAPPTIEAQAETVATSEAPADPETEWKTLLAEHYDLALHFFHATGVLKDAQKLQHLPDTYKTATRTRTADLIAKISKK